MGVLIKVKIVLLQCYRPIQIPLTLALILTRCSSVIIELEAGTRFRVSMTENLLNSDSKHLILLHFIRYAFAIKTEHKIHFIDKSHKLYHFLLHKCTLHSCSQRN